MLTPRGPVWLVDGAMALAGSSRWNRFKFITARRRPQCRGRPLQNRRYDTLPPIVNVFFVVYNNSPRSRLSGYFRKVLRCMALRSLEESCGRARLLGRRLL